MECRINIKGQKIWVDDENSHATRPPTTDIVLYRDGEVYKTVTLDALGDGTYSFPCLIVWKNSSHQYIYRVDEPNVPDGYTKIIQGYNIVNTLNNIMISGVKTWNDNHNAEGHRPDSITLRLLCNGGEIESLNVASPPDDEDTAVFSFGEKPFADENGVPYAYSITEDAVEFYETTIEGFHVTNTLTITPFSFLKSSIRTGMSLQDAQFELLRNGVVQATAVSDSYGMVTFTINGTGAFQLQETQPPAGYMDNTTVYEVFVESDGTVTVDGMPASQFGIENTPTEYDVLLVRASETVEAYMEAPNLWPLHGTGETNLCMVDKILIESNDAVPVLIKWDYGIRDAAYFATHGNDITDHYLDGIPIDANDGYTVYLKYENDYEAVLVITVDNMRNGTAELPYLLLNFDTATGLEPSIPGIGDFTLDYMQGGGIKQTQFYEIYENINMDGKTWIPLGAESAESFTGGLNGNQHEINNLGISYLTGMWYPTGLFSRVANGAVIENLGLINCAFDNISARTAAFAGLVESHNGKTTVLRNLKFFGAVHTNASGAGIVADVSVTSGAVLIDGCTAIGTVSGNITGGIVGNCMTNNADAEILIANCYTNGAVAGTGIVGGIAGNISSYGQSRAKMEYNLNIAQVQGPTTAGGILGSGSSAQGGMISSSINRGNIYGVTHVGGIAGSLTCSSGMDTMTIQNCYNEGTLETTATSTSLTGGIVGFCHTFVQIQNCYNVSRITAAGGTQNIVGGITGNYGRIEHCASIGARCSSPQPDVARISPTTTSMQESLLNNNVAFDNMQVLINGVQKTPLDVGSTGTDGIDTTSTVIKTQTLYESSLGWDFDNVWVFGNGNYTLPVLKDFPYNLQPSALPAHLA